MPRTRGSQLCLWRPLIRHRLFLKLGSIRWVSQIDVRGNCGRFRSGSFRCQEEDRGSNPRTVVGDCIWCANCESPVEDQANLVCRCGKRSRYLTGLGRAGGAKDKCHHNRYSDEPRSDARRTSQSRGIQRRSSRTLRQELVPAVWSEGRPASQACLSPERRTL